jgi:hypothetical protein
MLSRAISRRTRDMLQMSVPTRNAQGNGRGGMERVATVVVLAAVGDNMSSWRRYFVIQPYPGITRTHFFDSTAK